MPNLRIVFMGTPDFAVASLNALVEAGYEVAAVVTAPDKPAGRGQKLNESAVKQYAVSKKLPLLQPEKLRDPDFIERLQALNADIHVVVAFRMLPQVVLNIPKKGTINLHGSLLPQYRGAAPINWAVINGETVTGVTTFFISKEIDTGNILFSKSIEIGADDSAGDVHDKLMDVGAQLVVDTVKAIEDGTYEEIPQDSLMGSDAQAGGSDNTSQTVENLKPAPKIFKEDCQIDWNQPVTAVYNKIRGLSPYPTAFTTLHDKSLKIFRAEKQEKEPAIQCGGFLTDGKSYLKFACRDGFICLLEVQFEGKKRMEIGEFLRGVRL